MTIIQVCFQQCADVNALYFALLSGSVCVCGDDASFLTDDKNEGNCNEPCSGDGTSFCGGDGDDYDLYELFDGEGVMACTSYL